MLNAGAGGRAANGRRDFRRECGEISMAVLWRRRSSGLMAFQDRARTAASWHSVSGAIPARIQKKQGIGSLGKAVLSIVSSFLVWELLHQTGSSTPGREDQCLSGGAQSPGQGAPGSTI